MYSRKPTQGKEGNAMFSIACLFAVQFVSFLEGRGIGAVPFPFPGIIVGIFCGLLCGGLLFSTRLGKQYASLWLLSLTAVSVLLWGNVLRNNDALSCYGACMLGAAVLPPVLARLLAASRSPGLHVGIAFAIGDFFWLFLYLLPAPPSAKFLQGILLVLQSVGGGLAAFDLWKANRAVPPVPEPELTHQGYRRYESLGYLTAITLVFFILNAFIDIPFYRMHDAAFPIPAQVHLFIWIVYPLTGLFIDKRGADMRLLLVCLGGNILPPTLIAISVSETRHHHSLPGDARRVHGHLHIRGVFSGDAPHHFVEPLSHRRVQLYQLAHPIRPDAFQHPSFRFLQYAVRRK